MRVSIPDCRREARAESRADVPQLTVHLGLDVERVLSAPDPALVAGDHELAHLVPQRLVVTLRLARERGHLGVHVEWRLAARLLPRRFGFHELADLHLGLGARGRRAGRRAPRSRVAIEREITLAHL